MDARRDSSRFKKLTDAIHQEGAKAAIQLGHCGNMTHYSTCGQIPVGASNGINIYSPTIVRALKEKEIETLVKDFGKSVHLARSRFRLCGNPCGTRLFDFSISFALYQ